MINYKFVNNGFNPELIKKAVLVGKYDMPLIKKTRSRWYRKIYSIW